MNIKKGDKNQNVARLQRVLLTESDGIFGNNTEKLLLEKFNQSSVDDKIWEYVTANEKNIIIEGYHCPFTKIKDNVNVSLSQSVREIYIPELEKIENISEGLKLLAIIMTQSEGFIKGSRSYRTNNPGNIGNVDSGGNNNFKTLREGIEAQLNYLRRVAKGEHPAYKFGKKTIKPFYSKEIANNQKNYGNVYPYLAGYNFEYQGELAGFVKIYSTMARATNGYLSNIISFFKKNNIIIDENTKLSDLI